MGGFILTGPTKVFASRLPPHGLQCKCMGYRADISAEEENTLKSKSTLNPSRDLSAEHVKAMSSPHVSECLQYDSADRYPRRLDDKLALCQHEREAFSRTLVGYRPELRRADQKERAAIEDEILSLERHRDAEISRIMASPS